QGPESRFHVGNRHSWPPVEPPLDRLLQYEIALLQIAMTLGQKLRQLRHLEGDLRGLGRELTQSELVRAIRTELGESISQSYLSLIEKGARRHLSHESRQLLARFFKVHPGYLV